MKNCKPLNSNLVLTGIGITSSIGQGRDAFKDALLQGDHAFSLMTRAGRQKDHSFIGAELSKIKIPDNLSKNIKRNVSFTAQVAAVTIYEAWNEAKLESEDPDRIGLIIGGSNIQQREMIQFHEKHRKNPFYLRPSYGFSFMDSDICGLCTELLNIRGFAYTVGGASASGQLAIIQALHAVQSGQVDVCIALGALMDLSYWECFGLKSLGAMGSDRFHNDPAKASRPFDKDRDGFIFGESCAAVVVERVDSCQRKNIKPYAKIAGWSIVMDGNRNPNPSYDGEVKVITNAIKNSNLSAEDIDYINPHGTGSLIGDEIEIRAIKDCGLSHAYINTTKSIIGHGLSAAGASELVAILLQIESSMLHPNRNLDNPIDESCNWVGEQQQPHTIKNALNLSMGFGGINTCICLQSIN